MIEANKAEQALENCSACGEPRDGMVRDDAGDLVCAACADGCHFCESKGTWRVRRSMFASSITLPVIIGGLIGVCDEHYETEVDTRSEPATGPRVLDQTEINF